MERTRGRRDECGGRDLNGAVGPPLAYRQIDAAGLRAIADGPIDAVTFSGYVCRALPHSNSPKETVRTVPRLVPDTILLANRPNTENARSCISA